MKHILLSLTAAALMAVPAVAQDAAAPASPASQLSTLMHSRALKGAKFLEPTAASRLIGQPTLLSRSAKANRPVLRADDAKRSHKELSYQVNGDESQAMGLVGLFAKGDLASMGYTGWGAVSAFNTDMLSRYAGNKISQITFAIWKANYTNLQAVILDGNTGKILWYKKIDNPNTFSQDKQGVKGDVNTVACDYTITGDTPLLIGWLAQQVTPSAQDGANGQYDGILPYFDDNTGAGLGAYILASDSKGNFGMIGSASSIQDQDGSTISAAAYILAQTTGDSALKDADAYVYGTSTVRGTTAAGKGSSRVAIANLGLDPIKSFDYTFTLNGQETKGTYTFADKEELGFYQDARVNLSAPIPSAAGTGQGTFTITKVNSVDDQYADDNAFSYNYASFDKGYRRVPVVEEFTSTTCGWCPYGLAGMKRVNEKTDGRAVLIGIHTQYNTSYGTDVLEIDGYKDFVSANATAYPTVLVNREYSGHAYNAAPALATAVSEQLCEANMTIAVGQLPTSKLNKTISVSTTLDFSVPVADKTYGLAYVITEDGVTGISQLNYFKANIEDLKKQYPNYTEDEIIAALGWGADADLTEYAKTGTYNAATQSYWFTPTFDHVAAGVSSLDGSESIVPATAVNTPVTVKATLTLPERTRPAINRDNLKVAVLLIDLQSGVAITGAQVAPGVTSVPTDIKQAAAAADAADITMANGAFNVKAANATAQVYDLTGKLVSSATVNGEASLPTFGKGVYVIRVVANGHVTTQKAAF